MGTALENAEEFVPLHHKGMMLYPPGLELFNFYGSRARVASALSHELFAIENAFIRVQMICTDYQESGAVYTVHDTCAILESGAVYTVHDNCAILMLKQVY